MLLGGPTTVFGKGARWRSRARRPSSSVVRRASDGRPQSRWPSVARALRSWTGRSRRARRWPTPSAARSTRWTSPTSKAPSRCCSRRSTALGGLHIAVTTAGGGIGERTIKKDGPHSLDSFRQAVDLNLIGTFNISRLAAWQMSKNDPVTTRPRSAASSSTPRRSPRSRARSGRSPTPRPRPRSPACA